MKFIRSKSKSYLITVVVVLALAILYAVLQPILQPYNAEFGYWRNL